MCTSLPSPHSLSSFDSVLCALNTLSPPSPDINIRDLATLCSSGEIPIFLHSGITVSLSFGSVNSLRSLASFGSKHQSERETRPSTPGTAGTGGTFGRPGGVLRQGDVEHTDNSRSSSSRGRLDTGYSAGNPEKADSGTVDSASGVGDLPMPFPGASSPRRQSLCPSSRSIGSLETYSSFCERILASGSLEDALSSRTDAPLITPPPSSLALPIPGLPPPSEAILDYNMPTSDSNVSQHTPLRTRLRTSLNKKLHRVTPDVVPSNTGQHTPSEAQPLSHPPMPGASSPIVSPKARWRGRPRGGSNATVASVQSALSSVSASQSPRRGPSQAPPVPEAPVVNKSGSHRQSLPVSLGWLKGTIIELTFDQEGYRAARPSFRLAGYSGPRDADDDVAFSMSHHLCSGQADFMPLKREVFAFHHAALEPAPILRRLTMKGDNSHDYISKQATLTVKTNGVYTVHGTESSHSHSPFHFDLSERDPTSALESQTTLNWKLDYFVGDKRTDKGKLVPGEKTFTPLLFSCSPGLLHASHKKKIGFKRMIKKSLVAKLTAERVEVPALPPIPASHRRLSAQRPPSVPDGLPTILKRKSFLMGHRRAKSQASTKIACGGLEKDLALIRSPEMKFTSSWDADMFLQAQSTLKRISANQPVMALSSRSRSSSCSSRAQSHPRHPVDRLVGAVPGTLEKHIVPKSMLASMFSDDSSSGPSEGSSRPTSKDGGGSVEYTDGTAHRVPLSPPKYRARRMTLSK